MTSLDSLMGNANCTSPLPEYSANEFNDHLGMLWSFKNPTYIPFYDTPMSKSRNYTNKTKNIRISCKVLNSPVINKNIVYKMPEKEKGNWSCKYRRYIEGDMSAACLNPYCGPAACLYVKWETACPFFISREDH